MPINPPRSVSSVGLPNYREAVTPIQFVKVGTAGKPYDCYGIRYSDGRVLLVGDRDEDGCKVLSAADCRKHDCRFKVISPKEFSGSPKVVAATVKCEGASYPAVIFQDRISFLGPKGPRCIKIAFAISEGCTICNRLEPGCAWG